MKVIVIPVHNQYIHLKKCIESVLSHTSDFNLLIVDDCSTDLETLAYIKEIDHLNNVWVIRNHDKPLGFTGSVNRGILFAMKNYEYDFNSICILNSDTEIVTKNWYDKIDLKIDKHTGIGGVVSNNALHNTVENVEHYLSVIDKMPSLSTVLVHGFCFFISRKLIEIIGVLDGNTFPHYGSEDDYCIKSVKNGFRNIIVGSVLVKHHKEASYSTARRAEILKESVPALNKRWGHNHIVEYVALSLKNQKKLNRVAEINYRKYKIKNGIRKTSNG